MRTHIGQRDLRGLLHHLTELPGQLQARLGPTGAGLDVEHVAAESGHRQAGGHAGHRGALARFRDEAGPPEVVDQFRLVDDDRPGVRAVPGDQPGRGLAQRLGQQPLELPHPGLAGVVRGDLAQRRVGHRHLVGRQCGPVLLPGQQIVAGDRDLVVLGVAVDGHQFHPVQQRSGDVLDDVGGRQEHHIGQVQVQIQVMVAERVVLRRVEHLQQRRARITPVVGADLVDLVQQHNGIHRAGLADRAHDAAGQRPDVGATVPADLGLVAHAAEGHPDELAAQGAGHGLTQRRLADARGTRQHQHRTGAASADDGHPALRAPGAHRQVFHDAFLDVGQPVMVGVQDGPGPGQVGRVLGVHGPRQIQHRVQPGADPAALRALVAGAFQLVDLAQRGLAHVLGQFGGLDA